MLFKETVEPKLLELTRQLCAYPLLKNFVLVGGTALSLQIGHRKSIDIDLFTTEPFETDKMANSLVKDFNFFINNRFTNTILGTIDTIKTDILSHQYRLIGPVTEIEGIRMASCRDIAAMKLNAITDNGSRLKDFIDIAFLSSYFTLQQMLDFFEMKYPGNSSIIALKSLCYFEDINFDVDIIYQGNTLTWKTIHSRIIEMVQNPQKKFNRIK